MENIHVQRIARLRELMRSNLWDAVYVSASDPHASEYPAPRWKQVEWLSGFTGEAGELVITKDYAGLWTDSRYFIQAVEQLRGTGIELQKTRVPGAVGIPQWLAENVSVVVIDGLCQSVGRMEEIRDAFSAAGKDGCLIIDVPDLIDKLWTDRPFCPVTPVVTLDEESVGESRLKKISWLRKFLMMKECDSIILSSLDEIAWLLNVRGSDIEYNPLVISYLLVTMDEVRWYVGKGMPDMPFQDTVDSFNELRGDGITVCGYGDIALDLSEMREDGTIESIFLDTSTLNYNLYRQIVQTFSEEGVVSGSSPVILRKAVKNECEIRSLREAYVEDGVAMEKFLWWLEKRLASGMPVDEKEASDKLSSLRAEIPGYRGDSFANISAYGSNAALPHYSFPATGSAVLRPHGLYLVDSGGQYVFGTTDITRTVPLGECSDLEKEDYTLVLKGMIALSMAVFPKGTPGSRLDVLARSALWRSKRNFGHGTGHGIGFYLCVHEGPQDIRQNFNSQPLLPGMVTSNEPGIYREGMHGVRHENIVLCREAGTNEFGEWMEFETLTCCHIETSAVVRSLMTADEIGWLNEYNAGVYKKLSPFLDPEVSGWLKEKTQKL